MSSRNAGTVPETSAERALSDYAMSRFRDYKTRWAPLQSRLATTVENMGKENSPERQKLKASQAADVTSSFDSAQQKVAQQDINAGINRNSSRSKLQMEGMRTDRAASTGIGDAVSDQMIDDAYVGGLQQLMDIGRGQQAVASKGIGQSAQIAGEMARNDAAMSSANRAANYEEAGTLAGIGGGMMMRRMGSGIKKTTSAPADNIGSADYDTLGVGLPTFS